MSVFFINLIKYISSKEKDDTNLNYQEISCFVQPNTFKICANISVYFNLEFCKNNKDSILQNIDEAIKHFQKKYDNILKKNIFLKTFLEANLLKLDSSNSADINLKEKLEDFQKNFPDEENLFTIFSNIYKNDKKNYQEVLNKKLAEVISERKYNKRKVEELNVERIHYREILRDISNSDNNLNQKSYKLHYKNLMTILNIENDLSKNANEKIFELYLPEKYLREMFYLSLQLQIHSFKRMITFSSIWKIHQKKIILRFPIYSQEMDEISNFLLES